MEYNSLMSYKEKPQLKLFAFENNAFVLKAIVDDYQEVSIERNLYEAGAFTITINYNIPNALKFERGLFIQFGNDSYDFGEIITVSDTIGEEGKGSQIRTIVGYDARYILKRRVIKNTNSNGLWVMTAKGELCLRNLIKDQCGSGAEAKRQLPIENVIPQEADAIGKVYSVSEQFTNLYEVCKTIATQTEIGWRMKFINGTLILECYNGADKSQTVRFDTSYDSLSNGEFSDSSDSFSNAVYVGGKGQNDDRDIYEGENGTPSGFDRFESWDNQSQMTVESEYEAEAISMLTQYGQTVLMSGNGLAKSPYVYKEQYNVGDWITVAFSGKSAVVQILSVTEHWVWGTYDIQFTFGKPQPTQSDQLQLMLRKIQSASNKASSTDSIRWYTIPTDTAMPKADVTYNTIGFIGDIGSADKTFTLYLDNEKTGAKTYHVYIRQLAGSGKLKLTTGKSGATDIQLDAGTYVVIIYVDENGNIRSTYSENANYANSAGSANTAQTAETANTAETATSATTAETSDLAVKVRGRYTGSGGQQNPQYVGKERVCFNMMNTSVLSDTTYKDWLMMDCYSGFDVGGTTAFGISRTQLRAYIMRANAGTSPDRPTSWAQSGEVAIISAKGWNTTSGYIDFSNGLKMQWGVDTSSANTYKTVTASRMGTKAFFQVMKYDTNQYGQQTNLGIKYISATSISVDSAFGQGTKSAIFWFAIGY